MDGKMSSEDYEQVAKEMRAWLNSQPHLPKDVSHNMLCRFAHSCYFDMEKAKKAADIFFTMRRDYPHIYTDRDPRAPHMQKLISVINIGHLDLSEQRKLFLWQLKDSNLEHYDLTLDAKFHFLVNDCWFLANEERFYENDIHLVVDFKNLVSFKIFLKLNMLTARILAKYQRAAVPIRLKQVHLVNVSHMAKRVFSVVKPLFSKKILNLARQHTISWQVSHTSALAHGSRCSDVCPLHIP